MGYLVAIFQFPPPRGGEPPEGGICPPVALRFQFPPPRGGELSLDTVDLLLQVDFNSRPREGANKLTGEVDYLVIDFNSRPREGANPVVGYPA